ncbi:DUF1828 domain-containing protein [Macrococcus lamae]|uniref:DUF1828 domain-containing protein n=1 Tax=Macrococcus lamae TaxID=198484 RepID=A0A4R6BSD7_9STAP|nr:DUF1828 domain-containing protein [Macrococcus lamae]
MKNIDQLMNDYFLFLKNKSSINYLNEVVEIETPFRNHINDYIRIYVEPLENNQFRLSDDGQTLNELEM